MLFMKYLTASAVAKNKVLLRSRACMEGRGLGGGGARPGGGGGGGGGGVGWGGGGGVGWGC
jgi:hypothetical protein